MQSPTTAASAPPPRTVSELLARAVAQFGDAEALVDGAARLSFTALGEEATRAARAAIAAGIERLVPFAEDHGVRLGIEPLHPMMIGERSAIVTLGEALALARDLDSPNAGVVVDVYHVFWDPHLEDLLSRAQGLIAGHHVCDWLVPTTDLLAGRGLMGDGIIDLPRIRALIDATGYDGPIEVEVINPALADVPPDDLLEDIKARFARG